MSGTTNGLQLRSLIKKCGELELSLAEVLIPEPGPDQVLVKVEATPINPSDLGLLLGPADMSTAKASGSGAAIKITAKVPEQALSFIAARLDQAMPVGNEGAGTVIRAGSSEAAQKSPSAPPFAIHPPRRIRSVSTAPLDPPTSSGLACIAARIRGGVRVSRAAACLRVVANVGTPQPSTPMAL